MSKNNAGFEQIKITIDEPKRVRDVAGYVRMIKQEKEKIEGEAPAGRKHTKVHFPPQEEQEDIINEI